MVFKLVDINRLNKFRIELKNMVLDLLSKKKDLQQVVNDPSPNGLTSLSFISSISQNKNGVITPTKTTVKTMFGSGWGHSAGLVPDPGANYGTTRYLREDGQWVTPPDTNTTYDLNPYMKKDQFYFDPGSAVLNINL